VLSLLLDLIGPTLQPTNMFMIGKHFQPFATLAIFAALAMAQTVEASLIHRYSFNETSGTTVKDSVGTADGQIKGNGAYFTGDGQLVLPGLTGSADAADVISGYVDLPNHMINVLTNVTVECWVTWQGSGSWERIFDFGTSAGGEDVVNGDGTYLFLSPAGASNLRFAVRELVSGTEPTQITAPTPLDVGVETCVTATYDYTGNISRLYSNGVQIVTGTATVDLKTINDVNNWLGRSQWADPMFQGQYNEFRIYDTALSPLEAAASYASGIATPSTDAAALGAPQALIFTVVKTALLEGDKQDTTTTADFAKAQNVSLAGAPGVAYKSDNPSSVTIDSQGRIDAVSAGTANVSVSYLGLSQSVAITVSRRVEGVATAGTLYVDLRAADASANAATWNNRANQDDFYAEGAPTYVANVENSGVPGVRFAGADAYFGPVTTVDLHGGSDRTIEVWAFNPAIASEETLVAWARRGGPDRSNMSFNYGVNGSYGAVGHWGEDVGWNGAPPAGIWHYLVYTYDGSVARVYANGLLKNTRAYPSPLDTYADYPIRLGAQTLDDGSGSTFGQALTGYLGFVRVHGGVLSDNDIKNNFLYGMDLTAPGSVQGIAFSLDIDTIIGVGGRAQGTVLATYANRSYFYVNGYTTFESSDTNIATVDATGLVTSKALGSVDITATYQGKKATQTLKVLSTPPAQLVHRYSFGEAVGSTSVKDSVGTAHGTVKGNGAAFDGAGQLSLPGGASADPPETVGGYVDLPNGIISVLTNASFEAWVTWDGPTSSAWQRIFDFGTSDGGEDVVNGNGGYLFLSPAGAANLRFAVRDPATGTEPVIDTASQPLPVGVEVYVAVSYDYGSNSSKLYSNAVQVASGPASVALKTINDVNNWLGRSQWGDAMYAGKYNEFRIWDGPLTAEEIAASHAAGPDKLPEAPVEPPAMTIALSGANVIIGWPQNATGFVLESTLSLGTGAAWSPIDTSGAVIQGDQKQITQPVAETSKYYRMRK